MKKFVFAALTVTAVISATASGAFQRAPQAQLTEDGAAGWSIAESGAAPGWSITARSRAHVVSPRRGTVETVG